MTDNQITATIEKILRKMQDSKTGYKAVPNRLIKQAKSEITKIIGHPLHSINTVSSEIKNMLATGQITQAQHDAAFQIIQNRAADMRAAVENVANTHPGLADATYDEKRFCLTGKEIMENGISASCGNAAKAFCYVNSQLPESEQLDIQILFSTDPVHLIDGMAGHTVPCIKMSDGKLHAFDPQITLTDDEPHVKFLSGDIQVGGYIKHLLPSIAEKGRDYKITKIISPTEHEEIYSNFKTFLNASIERPADIAMVCNGIDTALKQAKTSRKYKPEQNVYNLCKQLPTDIAKLVKVYKNAAYINFNNQWYSIKIDSDYLVLARCNIGVNMPTIDKLLLPEDFIKQYKFTNGQQTVIKTVAEKFKYSMNNDNGKN